MRRAFIVHLTRNKPTGVSSDAFSETSKHWHVTLRLQSKLRKKPEQHHFVI